MTFALLAVCFAAAGLAAPPSAIELVPPDLEVPREPAAPPRARKADLVARGKALRTVAPAKAASSKVVDCAKGNSLQEAIDKSTGEVILEVRGLCNENVRIERRKLTLHGLDPVTDGIRGVTVDPPVIGALEVWYSELVHIENLSIRHPSGVGVGLWHSGAEMKNCQMTANGNAGVHVSGASFLDATELTLSDNGRQGLNVQRGSLGFCLGCRLENNATWAATANRGSLLSVLDSVVTGGRGVQALTDSYADIDCVSEDTAYPCSLNVTRTAALATVRSTAAMYGAGPFAGQLAGSDHGEVYVYGAQQTSSGVGPSGNTLANFLDYFSTLIAEPYVDTAQTAHQSQLKGTTRISSFSRALLIDGTTVNGSVSCDSAGDAWKDAGVTFSGGGISGCEHAP
jgi:hypothetical protein